MSPMIMNALFVVPVWGHGVGSQLFQPLPENDMKTGQIVTAAIVALLQVSSSQQPPAAPSSWVSAHGATSLLIFLFLGWAGLRRGWRQESLHHFICHLKPVLSSVTVDMSHVMLTEAGCPPTPPPPLPVASFVANDQLTSSVPLIPRPWGQEVGLVNKSHFSTRMSAASLRFA